MREMTPAECRDFLLHSTRTAKLSTVRSDGRPHIAPIGFLLDEDAVIFTTGETSVKGKNIRRDPRVSLCVDDETPPFAFVIIEGNAEILLPTPADLLDWAIRINRRYMGDDQAEAYARRTAVPGELLVRVTPLKTIAWKDVANW